MTLSTQSGFFIQSTYGKKGNFEVIVPWIKGGLAHYWRDNDAEANSSAWHGPTLFGEGHILGVSFIEGDYQVTDNDHGDFELVALRQVARRGSDGRNFVSAVLEFYFRENQSPFNWHGPYPVDYGAEFLPGSLVPNPSLIQGGYGFHEGGLSTPFPGPAAHQNFYLACPTTNGSIAFFTRHNDHGYGRYGPSKPKHAIEDKTWLREPPIANATNIFANGICLFEGLFGTTDVNAHSFLQDPRQEIFAGELVFAACSGGDLIVYYGDIPNWWTSGEDVDFYGHSALTWRGPIKIGSGYKGRPSLVMSDFGYSKPLLFHFDHYGNYEMVVPRIAGGLSHFWRDNGETHRTSPPVEDGAKLYNHASSPWRGECVFGRGDYDEVSLIQSNFSSSGDNGNLELIARRSGQLGFDFYWRADNGGCTWNGPYGIGTHSLRDFLGLNNLQLHPGVRSLGAPAFAAGIRAMMRL